MENYKEVTCFAGIERQEGASALIAEGTLLVKHALSRLPNQMPGLSTPFTLCEDVEFAKRSEDFRKKLVGFCGEHAGIAAIVEPEDYINAIDNSMFTQVFNAIEVGVIRKVMTQIESNAINVIANVDTVGFGNSKTYVFEGKGYPIAQRASYSGNVAFLNGSTQSTVTVVPKPYNLGVSMDLVRILKGDQDWGRETAKVIYGLLYAQYQLVVNTLYSTSLLTSTPFLLSTYDTDDHLSVIEILKAVNGGAPVVGYGVINALRKIGIGAQEISSSVFGGFQIQDEFIRNGFVSHVNGIDYVLLNQAFDYSAPLSATIAGANAQLLLPTDKVLLLCAAQDKPVKLVRENMVRVRQVEAQDNAVLTRQYAYFMSFDAAIATMSQFAIQTVA